MLQLIYVKPLSACGNDKRYALYFSENPENAWGPDWDFNNPAICGDISPDPSNYTDIVEIVSPMPLKTAQEMSCHSMSDATKGIVALSWIDIEGMESYPDNGRMVLHFGDEKESVLQLVEKSGAKIAE